MADKTLGQLADELGKLKIGWGLDASLHPMLDDAAAAMRNAEARITALESKVAALTPK